MDFLTVDHAVNEKTPPGAAGGGLVQDDAPAVQAEGAGSGLSP